MSETLVSVFLERARSRPERIALRVLSPAGEAVPALTWGEWEGLSARVAAALVDAGHRPGEAVAVLAGNRPLWPVADLGILMAGGVSVGLYPTSAPEQVRQVLADCEARVVVVDTAEQLEKVEAARGSLPHLRTIVCQDESRPGVPSWAEWLGAAHDGRAPEVERRISALAPEEAALLVYTSGSTGEPKGARLTHRTALASARSIRQVLGLTEHDTVLSFLPYCHSAERIFGLYTRVECGMEALLVEDHARVWEAARAYAPSLFGGLPRFFEKAYEALRREQEALEGEARERWERTLELGRARSRLRRDGLIVPANQEAEWRRTGQPVFERVRALFGGGVRVATSGGAALPTEVAEYLDALGVTVLGAYGLTEHLCVAFNRPDRYAFDAVGLPMPGTELQIAPDGEILVRRGALTFDGYFRRDADTGDAFTEDGGWLRTGDLGRTDERGFLRVTGRKKELIALSGGKKVAPAPIEARLVRHPWVHQAMVYGEGKKFLSALLVLSRTEVEAWARAEGVPGSYEELLHHPELLARVQLHVDHVNEAVSRPEQIRRVLLLERELSVEAEEVTPTLKIRRQVVAERLRDRLEALYASA